MTADFSGAGHAAADVEGASERARRGADFLRRTLTQIAKVDVLSFDGNGEVVFVTPAPALSVVEALAAAGVAIAPEGTWEGTIRASVGWWHRRSQLVGLAAGVQAFLDGEPIVRVESDRFESIPADLPRRHLGTIAPPEREELD